ncbi:MAG: IclR family transcriptional regulator [Desulfobacteraceae bacterium]|nr:IclR family transcriptional regulator [Desulfobacteraceae bacterium]
MSIYTSNKNQKPKNLVQTIERVSLILDILGQHPQGISVKELSAKVDLPKGTTHRLLSSLAYFDFVRQDVLNKNYLLGFKLVELGNLLVNQLDFKNEARPFMIDLAKTTGETIHLVILDQNEALYIDKVALHQTGLQMMSRVGLRIPVHCCSVGKILVAHLAEDELNQIIKEKGLPERTKNTITHISQFKKHIQTVRNKGYAIDNEENEKGIRCVAAPIRNANGKVIAAMSISGPSIRLTLKAIQTELKDAACDAALNISKKLGFRDE